jgi:alanyl-tRNA synthetase
LSKEKGVEALRKIFGLAKENINIDPQNLPKGMMLKGNKIRIHGSIIFHVYQQYGIPIEVSQEIMHDWGIEFDEQTMIEANRALVEHQDLSRTASAGMFKGGLADTSEETVKLHTTAHLMLAALRQVLGNHVVQKGANITAERLRFDFSHPEKMTEEQKTKVEELVNAAIKSNLDVVREEMPLEKARFKGAMGIFDSKYGDKVSVYSIADEKGKVVSCEICGGPHVKNTGELGHFKIIKEEASSAGVRRIKAILE